MTRYTLAVPAILAFVLLSACETIEGAGQDVQSAGQAISETAREADDE